MCDSQTQGKESRTSVPVGRVWGDAEQALHWEHVGPEREFTKTCVQELAGSILISLHAGFQDLTAGKNYNLFIIL